MFVKLPQIEFIYALHSGNDDFFYCGRTNNLERRLDEHRRDGDANGSKKQQRIHELQEAGKEIFIKPLMAGYPINLIGEEEKFICSLREQGYDLVNEAEGTDPTVVPFPGTVVPWSIDLFINGDWKKEPGCAVGEKACTIKGITFYRKGKSGLRFKSVAYGDQRVGFVRGSDITNAYVNAIAMLTPGTGDNEYMKQQIEQRLRLKG